ncbi:CCA tRNA nucleotidyltransferase [Desulfopila aestuarii]|uniref:Poly(A) polymerase n=1 Tax=Desulfopila aestuarii DSM 18488 TaxID=1121416 RepID=A0A1M7XZ67_9BACT|nr:HD domain-containing protein [Desulfopila aestuarii]SHO44465.1 poly(A) polymerase [Desulfopila aestuarii DSM 18488]
MENLTQHEIATRQSNLRGLISCFVPEIVRALISVAKRRSVELYVVGGTVRDWLLGRSPNDLDLTVATGAQSICRELMSELGGGALVLLGTEEEEAARVVWQGQCVDISAFRGGVLSINDDLRLRDFTINSLALPLGSLLDETVTPQLIDPMNGATDLLSGLLRHCPRAFIDDPLRLVRTFRFMATLGFEPVEATLAAIRDNAPKIQKVAAERLNYELDLIMQTDAAAPVLWEMHQSGLLLQIFPELYDGEGVEQPSFHHLDVFNHNFQALREMEMLLAAPEKYFGEGGLAGDIPEYLADNQAKVWLKWAALLHDVGKPAAKGQPAAKDGRITFYGHDEIGRKQVERIARRLKWSNTQRERVADLIGMHMHPFHLCNVRREQQLSARAALKLCRRAGEELPGLFLLAMSDSLAGSGELKPENMEQELVDLYREVVTIQREHIRPALSGPPLVNGRDLIEGFGLTPGPVFSIILDELLALQVEGAITTRETALAWVGRYLQEKNLQGRTEGKR